MNIASKRKLNSSILVDLQKDLSAVLDPYIRDLESMYLYSEGELLFSVSITDNELNVFSDNILSSDFQSDKNINEFQSLSSNTSIFKFKYLNLSEYKLQIHYKNQECRNKLKDKIEKAAHTVLKFYIPIINSTDFSRNQDSASPVCKNCSILGERMRIVFENIFLYSPLMIGIISEENGILFSIIENNALKYKLNQGELELPFNTTELQNNSKKDLEFWKNILSETKSSDSQLTFSYHFLNEKYSRWYMITVFFNGMEGDFSNQFTYMIEDITDQTESDQLIEIMEQKISKIQKMELISSLVAGIVHDFKNLINIISGYSQMLLRTIPENSEVYSDVKKIEESARQAKTLTNQLMQIGKEQTEELNLKEININDVLDNSINLFSRSSNINIEIVKDYEHELWFPCCDENYFLRAVLNILVNAADAMPEGGRIHIKTENIVTEKMSGNSIFPGPYVCITISDTGIGFSKEVSDKIFEPFYTTKKINGTGLGLSVTQTNIIKMNGYIFADSQVGKGSIFTIYLPAVQHNYQIDDIHIKSSNENLNKNKIIYYNSDLTQIQYSVKMINDLGFEAVKVTNENEFLKCISENIQINTLFIEKNEKDMNFDNLLRKCFSIRNNIKILVSCFDSYKIEKNVESSNVFCIQKPFDREMLEKYLNMKLSADKNL